MKRSQQRMPMTLNRRAYPSDLTDEQWELSEPLVPPLSAEAAYHVHARRELVNAILYVLRSGCPWRLLPHEFPAWGTRHKTPDHQDKSRCTHTMSLMLRLDA